MSDTSPEPDRCDDSSLAAYCAGELDATGRQAFEEHLVTCSTCWAQVCVNREVSAAVRRTWEPAPLSLRADLRESLMQAQQGGSGRRFSLVAAGVAAAVALIALVGLGIGQFFPVRDVYAASAAAAAVGQLATPPATPGNIPTSAPNFARIGLQAVACNPTTIDGRDAVRTTYQDASGHRLDLYTAAIEWTKPAGAMPAGATAWVLTMDNATVVGGMDRSKEHALVVSADHTMAMAAAAALAMV